MAREKYYSVAMKVNDAKQTVIYKAETMAHVRSAIIKQLVTIEQADTSDVLAYVSGNGKILIAAPPVEGESDGE